MAFQTEWIHSPYILATTFTNRISVTELNVALLEYLGAIQIHPTYFMMDFLEADAIPSEILGLPTMAQVMNHPNTQWLIFIRRKDITTAMTDLLARDKVKTYYDRRTALGFLRGMVRIDTGVILEEKSKAEE